MYTIKQAAARAGVPIPTLRAWERRYGVVRPARTPAGYRLYDDQAIERLTEMRRLVDDGWRPSLAAEVVAHGTGPSPAAAVLPVAVAGASTETDPAGDLRRRFIEAASSMDEISIERVLDDVFARGSFERVARDHLFPALRALGDAWASGDVGVAGEHLASHAVLRRLAVALDAAGGTLPRVGHVLVGLPPGARHELGALAFTVALRRAGVPVAYLGADLPADDWVRAARSAAAAVIGVVVRRDRRAAADVAARLQSEIPGLVVAVGGGAAEELESTGIIVLPREIDAAVARLREALAETMREAPSAGAATELPQAGV